MSNEMNYDTNERATTPIVPTPIVQANEPARKLDGFKFTKPKTYDGARDAQVIENWIYQVMEYCEGYELVGAKAVRVAASFLDGVALQYWRSVKMAMERHQQTHGNGNYGALTNVNELLDLIRNRFFPTGFIEDVRNKLDRLRQTRSARLYAQEFERLLFQLPMDSYHDQDMKDLFMRRLKNQTRLWVALSNPVTLADAIKAAERCDEVIYQHQVATRSVVRNTSVPMDVDAISQGNVRRSNNVKCYNCNKLGHYSRQCPEPETERTKSANQRKVQVGAVQEINADSGNENQH